MCTITEMATIATIEEELIPIVMAGIGGCIAVIAIVFGTIKRVSQTHQREKTRREIAAYVAEGSISPEDGERLMKAGEHPDRCR